MTIHTSHPFDDGSREAARQLRGRIGGRVAVITAGEGVDRAAWTVSSLALVQGEQWRLVAFVDPDCDLADRVAATGRAVLQFLDDGHQQLAEQAAGLFPAPGGLFRVHDWDDTAWGPRLARVGNWAGLRLESSRELGWLAELVFVVDEAHAGDDEAPLHHVRGRYRVLRVG